MDAYDDLQIDIAEAGGLGKQIDNIVAMKSKEFPNKHPELESWNNKLAVVRIAEIESYLDKKLGQPQKADIGRRVAYFWDVPGVKGTTKTYLRWELRDWWYYHNKPGDHADFFFGWISLNVPEHKLKNLRKISSSIIYYPLGFELGAGCHVRAASIATLSLVKMYVDDKITLNEAIDQYDKVVGRLVGEEMKNGMMNTPLADAYERYLLA